MNCRDCRSLFSALDADALAPSQEREVRAHLQSCADCAHLHEKERNRGELIAATLHSLPQPAAPSNLRANVRRALAVEVEQKTEKRRKSLFHLPLSAPFYAGGMALATLCLIVLARPFFFDPIPSSSMPSSEADFADSNRVGEHSASEAQETQEESASADSISSAPKSKNVQKPMPKPRELRRLPPAELPANSTLKAPSAPPSFNSNADFAPSQPASDERVRTSAPREDKSNSKKPKLAEPRAKVANTKKTGKQKSGAARLSRENGPAAISGAAPQPKRGESDEAARSLRADAPSIAPRDVPSAATVEAAPQISLALRDAAPRTMFAAPPTALQREATNRNRAASDEEARTQTFAAEAPAVRSDDSVMQDSAAESGESTVASAPDAGRRSARQSKTAPAPPPAPAAPSPQSKITPKRLPISLDLRSNVALSNVRVLVVSNTESNVIWSGSLAANTTTEISFVPPAPTFEVVVEQIGGDGQSKRLKSQILTISPRP